MFVKRAPASGDRPRLTLTPRSGGKWKLVSKGERSDLGEPLGKLGSGGGGRCRVDERVWIASTGEPGSAGVSLERRVPVDGLGPGVRAREARRGGVKRASPRAARRVSREGWAASVGRQGAEMEAEGRREARKETAARSLSRRVTTTLVPPRPGLPKQSVDPWAARLMRRGGARAALACRPAACRTPAGCRLPAAWPEIAAPARARQTWGPAARAPDACRTPVSSRFTNR